MSSSNIPGYSAFQSDVSNILKQLIFKINGYVTTLAANQANRPAIAPAAPASRMPPPVMAQPPIPPMSVAAPQGLTPQQAENFKQLNSAMQGRLAGAPLEVQQLTLNIMGIALARGLKLKHAEMISTGFGPDILEKVVALPSEKQNKILDVLSALFTAGDATIAAMGTPEYEKLAAESAKLKSARDAIFEETGLTKQRGGIRTKKARKMKRQKTFRKAYRH